MYMSYYGSFVLQGYVLRMRVMTLTVGGNLTNRPPSPKTYTCQKNRTTFLSQFHGLEVGALS